MDLRQMISEACEGYNGVGAVICLDIGSTDTCF